MSRKTEPHQKCSSRIAGAERAERRDRAAGRRPQRDRLRARRAGPERGDQRERRRVGHAGREAAEDARAEQHLDRRRPGGEAVGRDRQDHPEDEQQLAPVAVADRAEVEHRGGEAERVADRDEVERGLRGVEVRRRSTAARRWRRRGRGWRPPRRRSAPRARARRVPELRRAVRPSRRPSKRRYDSGDPPTSSSRDDATAAPPLYRLTRSHGQRKEFCMWWGIGAGGVILYLVLLFVLGMTCLRKGHWVMFIIGIFLPFFWIIGAVIPPARRGCLSTSGRTRSRSPRRASAPAASRAFPAGASRPRGAGRPCRA